MNLGSAPSQVQRLRGAMAARLQPQQQARAGLLPAQQPAPTAPTQSPRPAPAAAPVQAAPATPRAPTESMTTYRYYEDQRGRADWWRENVVKPYDQHIASRYPWRGFATGVMTSPALAAEIIGMVPAGVERMARTPGDIPRYVTGGLEMQARGIYEGATQRPQEFAGEMVGLALISRGVRGSPVRATRPAQTTPPTAYPFVAETFVPGVRGSRVKHYDVTGERAPMAETFVPGVRGSRVKTFDVTGQRAPMAETFVPGVRGSRVKTFDVTGKHPAIAETFVPGVRGSRVKVYDIEAAAEIGGVTVEFAQLGLFRRAVGTGRTRTIDLPTGFKGAYGPGIRRIKVPEYRFESRPASLRATIFGTGSTRRNSINIDTELFRQPKTTQSPRDGAQMLNSLDQMTFGTATRASTRTATGNRDIAGIDSGIGSRSAQDQDYLMLTIPRTTVRPQVDRIGALEEEAIFAPWPTRGAAASPGLDPRRLDFPNFDDPAPKKKRKKKRKKNEFDEFLFVPDLSSSLWRF